MHKFLLASIKTKITKINKGGYASKNFAVWSLQLAEIKKGSDQS
jgi:hypothetical protein